jgi:hypothetical protein
MIKNDRIINSLIYGDAIQKLAQQKNIGLTEARLLISEMSFNEYRALEEASADIVPPSGNKIAPTNAPGSNPANNAPVQSTGTTGSTPTPSPNNAKPGQTGAAPDPRGVQVKNPATGKVEWMKPAAAGQAQQMAEDKALARMRQLAGIKEDSSGGASCAGGIAVAPMPMGKVKRRQPTNEQQPKEYTRTEPAKTIIGDTKPGQASGELSANLHARGAKTASRNKNGLRR